MIKYYGTKLCPDCVEAEQKLEEHKLECESIVITDSTANLKEFLKLRDSRKEFEKIKAEGCIGIPCFLREDESIAFDVEELFK